MKFFIRCLVILVSLCPLFASAQLLPPVKNVLPPLNHTLLQRWFDTNKAIRDYQSLIEEMLPTEAEAIAFDKLTIQEQDNIVNKYLQRKGMFEPLNGNMKKLGWTGVADYMRVSAQIGNAIAADIEAQKVEKLSPDQAKQVMDKVDPAVRSVTPADLQFVRLNRQQIRQHIAGYATSN